jgi:predicted DNA-binding protein
VENSLIAWISLDTIIPLWYYFSMETLDEIAFSLRLPPALHRRLKKIARAEKRSMNKTVILAIEKMLENYEQISGDNNGKNNI